MSSFNSFLSASCTVMLITFGLSACGNNNETTTEEVGAAEEIRGTILDTTTKAAETTAMAAEKATEAANKAVEATSEAVEEATIAVADAVESATEAVENTIAVPSITPEEAADD